MIKTIKLFVLFGIMLCFSCKEVKDDQETIKFNHIMFSVNNMETSVNFYTKVFNMDVKRRFSKISFEDKSGKEVERDVNMAFLGFPDQYINLELIEKPNDSVNSVGPIQHFCLEVSNIKEVYTKAIEYGAGVKYEIENRRAGDIEVKIAFLIGPNGELIELLEYIKRE